LLVLALLAVPLSHLAPRQSRYSKMVYGLLAFLIYANFLGIGQAWIAKNQAAAAVGLWPVHIMMLGVTLLLIARRRGLLGGR
jgi:lipopolysaccharide export system permease protein